MGPKYLFKKTLSSTYSSDLLPLYSQKFLFSIAVTAEGENP
jgi:hypothetical protein